jgi:prepilin-type processing-associated H-X9-DG protein/prepilin-type N-terminal cleavage/methylation domain-containing protein
MREKTRRAFTLVELLVVIGIIAALIAILMPALGKAREQANAIKCLSNTRNLGNALVLFTQDHKGYLPKAWFNDGPVGSPLAVPAWPYRAPRLGWDFLLLRYLGNNKEVFRCPNDEYGQFRGNQADNSPDSDKIPASYRINISNQHVFGGPPDLPVNRPFYATKYSRLKYPARAILFFDGANSEALWHHVATWEVSALGIVSRADKRNVAWNRHRGRCNYTFVDGHAESLLWEDTWQFVATNNGMWHQFED